MSFLIPLLHCLHTTCKHTCADDVHGSVQKSKIKQGVLRIVDQIHQSQMLASMLICDSSRIRMDCKIIGDMQADTGLCA